MSIPHINGPWVNAFANLLQNASVHNTVNANSITYFLTMAVLYFSQLCAKNVFMPVCIGRWLQKYLMRRSNIVSKQRNFVNITTLYQNHKPRDYSNRNTARKNRILPKSILRQFPFPGCGVFYVTCRWIFLNNNKIMMFIKIEPCNLFRISYCSKQPNLLQ